MSRCRFFSERACHGTDAEARNFRLIPSAAGRGYRNRSLIGIKYKVPQRYPGLALLVPDRSHMKILSLDPFPSRENSVTPQLLPIFMFHEVEMGATTEEVAVALGVGMEWVRERVEATRLCFAHQVRIVDAQELSLAMVGDEGA